MDEKLLGNKSNKKGKVSTTYGTAVQGKKLDFFDEILVWYLISDECTALHEWLFMCACLLFVLHKMLISDAQSIEYMKGFRRSIPGNVIYWTIVVCTAGRVYMSTCAVVWHYFVGLALLVFNWFQKAELRLRNKRCELEDADKVWFKVGPTYVSDILLMPLLLRVWMQSMNCVR